jgi:hypothetical protein
LVSTIEPIRARSWFQHVAFKFNLYRYDAEADAAYKQRDAARAEADAASKDAVAARERAGRVGTPGVRVVTWTVLAVIN